MKQKYTAAAEKDRARYAKAMESYVPPAKIKVGAGGNGFSSRLRTAVYLGLSATMAPR